MRRFLGMAAVTAMTICTLVAFAVVANAHTVHNDSTISIQFKRGHGTAGDVFSGQVKSVKVACEHRTIKLFRRLDGGSKTLVAKSHTDRTGNWTIPSASTQSGTYYARAVKRVLFSSPKHLHVCKGANSKDVNVKSKP